MIILGIETSCDETGLALIENDNKGRINVLANLVSSQVETHRPFGGVVPNLAKREHQKNLPLLLDRITVSLRSYAHGIENIDLIAVTQGPGLAPCLWAGINFAQELAQKLNKPLVGINHLKGHIYINLLEHKITYPILSLIVSGGHTELVYSKKLGHYQIIGETLDDAAGEAFDKVAKLLGLGYPGGPEISKLATKGNPLRFNLPRPMINSKNYDFSFSGLKTAVLYLVKGFYPKGNPLRLTQKNKTDLCASFEQAVVDVLISKTLRAASKLTLIEPEALRRSSRGLSSFDCEVFRTEQPEGAERPNTLILGGGVAANKKLRETLESKIKKELPHVACLLSPIDMTGDNALMIALAALAEQKLNKPIKNPADLPALPNLRLDMLS